jgi:chromosome partitioning protein
MIISIVNHKGGTGKTTTTINVGSVLSSLGYTVLVVDLDAQGSLSYSLGISEHAPTLTDALMGDLDIQHIIQKREGMDVLPSTITLADVELAIAKAEERYFHLKELISSLPPYDFTLIDCAPSLSLLTLNALAMSTSVIIPMQMDVLALRGLGSMLETIKKVNTINPGLTVLGVLPIMVDPRKNIYQEILAVIKSSYTAKVFKQAIRASVKAAEAPSFGQSVVSYAPSSTTASDYKAVTMELLKNLKMTHSKNP